MSVSFQFPLLKLPSVAAYVVFFNFEMGDLVHFSFLSKRTHHIVKSMRIKLTKFDITVTWKGTTFILTCGEVKLVWRFNQPDFYEESKDFPVVAMIGGLTMKSFFKNDWLHSYTDGDFEQTAKAGLDYIKSIFLCPFPIATIFPDGIPEQNRPFFTGICLCDNLIIEGNKEMKEDEMKEVLRKLPVIFELVLSIPIGRSVEINSWLLKEPETLHIFKSGHCIGKSILKSTKCRNIWINDCKFRAHSCVSFVEDWFKSDDTNFNCLKLSWLNDFPWNLNYESLELDLMPFDPEVRHSSYKYRSLHAIDLSAAKDFIRSDGTLASVAIIGKSFLFCVWHDRFPNTNGLKTIKL